MPVDRSAFERSAARRARYVDGKRRAGAGGDRARGLTRELRFVPAGLGAVDELAPLAVDQALELGIERLPQRRGKRRFRLRQRATFPRRRLFQFWAPRI